MALLGTIQKQTTEKYTVDVDFTNRLVGGETVSTAAVTIKEEATGTDTSGTMLTGSHSITQSNTKVVSPYVISGTNNLDYILQFAATTSTGNIYEEEVRIQVRNV